MIAQAYLNNTALPVQFFNQLSEFATYWLRAELLFKKKLLEDIVSASELPHGKEQPNLGEAYLEFLMLGILISTYGNYAVAWDYKNVPYIQGHLTMHRESVPDALLCPVQPIHGMARDSWEIQEMDFLFFGMLLRWMKGVTELQNEAAYLDLWHHYLQKQELLHADSTISIARLSAESFVDMAEHILGKFMGAGNRQARPPFYFNSNQNGYHFSARSRNELFVKWFGLELLQQANRNRSRQPGQLGSLLWPQLPPGAR